MPPYGYPPQQQNYCPPMQAPYGQPGQYMQQGAPQQQYFEAPSQGVPYGQSPYQYAGQAPYGQSQPMYGQPQPMYGGYGGQQSYQGDRQGAGDGGSMLMAGLAGVAVGVMADEAVGEMFD